GPLHRARQRLSREIEQVGRRVDLAPARLSNSGHETTDVSGRHQERPARLQPARRLFDRTDGARGMLDRVPEADEVERLGLIGQVQEVALADLQTKSFPAVAHTLLRNVDPLDVPVRPGQLEEEAVGGPDFQQSTALREPKKS